MRVLNNGHLTLYHLLTYSGLNLSNSPSCEGIKNRRENSIK